MLDNKHISLIVTVKNRVDHFVQIFSSLITQYGVEYSLVFSDFGSRDGFLDKLHDEILIREKIFSPYLKEIRCIQLLEDLKFNPRKAKNLGIRGCEENTNILAFSDVDTFIGMDYLYCWSDKIIENESFFATRQQESKAAMPHRLKPEINYGNIIVYKKDFLDVNGWDESIGYYGGDDDDLFHRLKLKGLREINPISHVDAKQYSILHGEEERISLMEQTVRVNQSEEFTRIYSNNIYNKSICNYCFLSENKFKLLCIYRRKILQVKV
jgi:hypothetical protein